MGVVAAVPMGEAVNVSSNSSSSSSSSPRYTAGSGIMRAGRTGRTSTSLYRVPQSLTDVVIADAWRSEFDAAKKCLSDI